MIEKLTLNMADSRNPFMQNAHRQATHNFDGGNGKGFDGGMWNPMMQMAFGGGNAFGAGNGGAPNGNRPGPVRFFESSFFDARFLGRDVKIPEEFDSTVVAVASDIPHIDEYLRFRRACPPFLKSLADFKEAAHRSQVLSECYHGYG